MSETFTTPTIEVKFSAARQGYRDGGARSSGTFSLERPHAFAGGHPGPGETLKWSSWELNFWFCAGSGRSWQAAIQAAIRRLQHLCKAEATIRRGPDERHRRD